MDFILRQYDVTVPTQDFNWGFNPCFNGFHSPTEFSRVEGKDSQFGFNPCFNGFHSPTNINSYTLRWLLVSILVLMDFILRLQSAQIQLVPLLSFNPCFNGFHSPTPAQISLQSNRTLSFNPCFNGFHSPTR